MSVEIANEVAGGVLGTLGINWKLLIAQLVNFLVVLLVLWRWVWKPVVNILDKRSEKIEQSIADAKNIEAQLVALENKKKDILREAEIHARAIIDEASVRGESLKQESMAKTRLEVEKLVGQGREQLKIEKTKIVEEARGEVAGLVVAATAKLIGEEFDDKHNDQLVKKILQGL